MSVGTEFLSAPSSLGHWLLPLGQIAAGDSCITSAFQAAERKKRQKKKKEKNAFLPLLKDFLEPPFNISSLLMSHWLEHSHMVTPVSKEG